MKVVLAHDWLNGMRGGEKCLEVLCELFPDSPIYTLFHEPGRVSAAIERHPIRTSRVQRFPGALRHYRYYLPLFPSAIEAFDVEPCDVLVSTSHCVAKGLRKPAGAKHLCYCFSPMRYAWSLFGEYFGDRDPVSRALIGAALERLREWDKRSNADVDRFVGISEHIRRRIGDCYGRDADVIYPPADTAFYTPSGEARDGGYLVVSALVPYKRVDLAVRAAALLDAPLTVIGEGPEAPRLRRMAGPRVRFLGWQSDEAIRAHYRRAKALLFPGEEDFGIVPVEAQACGCPVVAFAKGGALETVREGATGTFFAEPDAASLAEAVRRLERLRPDPAAARASALRFSRERFKAELGAAVASFAAEPAGTVR